PQAVWHPIVLRLAQRVAQREAKIVKNIITLLHCTGAASTAAVYGRGIHDDPLSHSIRSRCAGQGHDADHRPAASALPVPHASAISTRTIPRSVACLIVGSMCLSHSTLPYASRGS